VATSIDLIRYINSECSDQFITGAAFNPYNPMPFELNRLKQKIDAGAKYVVTQPILGKDKNVDRLKEFDIAVVVEAWMSNNIDLLYKSVCKEKDEKADKYDPLENLKALHEYYPEYSVYLSMLSFTSSSSTAAFRNFLIWLKMASMISPAPAAELWRMTS
jgi:methylenetetrahydrofolate reductase (NADPH)